MSREAGQDDLVLLLIDGDNLLHDVRGGRDEGGSVADLLRSNVSVTQSEDLAGLYGIDAWSGSGAYPTFDPAERAGLLQRAALLVSNLEQTNPFHRGALVRRAILCDSLPQPDPNSLPPSG